MNRPRRTSFTRCNFQCALCALTLPSLFLCSCAQEKTTTGNVRVVTVADFSKREIVNSPEHPAPSSSANSRDVDLESSSSSEISVSSNDVQSSSRHLKPGEQVVVDGVVGQVSGRPIFVDDLLEPVADQLKREGERLPRHEFITRARDIVNARLNEVVLEELFIAEAEVSLTKEERVGLLSLMRDIQERTVARGAGSRTRTESELQEEHGVTLEEFQELQRKGLLIQKLLHEKIEPRVIVAWKDVEREYERRKNEFVPQATVTLKRLRFSNDTQSDLIEGVKSRFFQGESFDEIYESFDPPEATTLDPLKMGPGGITDVPIRDDYKPALSGLSLGESTDAIELDNRTLWFHVASIDQEPAQSIYDVQRQLINELTIRRRNEQRERYIRSLLEKGIYDELDAMSQRLLTAAILRYSK